MRVLEEMAKPLNVLTPEEIKAAVSDRYGQVASAPSGKFNFPVGRKFAESVGYPADLLARLPPALWESFTGAGNPQPHVRLQPGFTIMDLGCGAGLDLYLYTQAVGPQGKVYGVDLAPEMVAKARDNMDKMSVSNVEVLHGSSDKIPLPDESIDVVCSNGIYNLSPDKKAVMKEVFRALKPGGYTIFAEVVLSAPMPRDERMGIDDWFRCIGGALPEPDFLGLMREVGFAQIDVLSRGRNARTGHKLAVCANIRAEKPAGEWRQ